jgi:hypothetical protein
MRCIAQKAETIMKFEEVMVHLRKGCVIQRSEWGAKGIKLIGDKDLRPVLSQWERQFLIKITLIAHYDDIMSND